MTTSSREDSTKLREHVEAARAQAFAEIAQVLDARYRAAFAEFTSACNHEGASVAAGDEAAARNDRTRRRTFTAMDTWCQALTIVQAAQRNA